MTTSQGLLPTLPDDDADFTPDLARKVIAKYQDMLRHQGREATEFLAMTAPNDETGVLQNDLREMLQALGMNAGAQPRSPHEVFQTALTEMKIQLARRPDAPKTKLPEVDMAPLRAAKRTSDARLYHSTRGPQVDSGREWQPIETAPKDGSYVLISSGEYVDIARWSHGSFGGFDRDDELRWQPLPKPHALHPERGGRGA